MGDGGPTEPKATEPKAMGTEGSGFAKAGFYGSNRVGQQFEWRPTYTSTTLEEQIGTWKT
eukprot:10311155-Karenia_brevis.AAC.1